MATRTRELPAFNLAALSADERVALLEEENNALEGALTLSRKRLQAMRAAANALRGRLNLDNLLPEIIAQVSALTDCDRASLFLVDEERQELWSRVAEGVEVTNPAQSVPELQTSEGDAPSELDEAPVVKRGRIRLPLGQGIAGHVAKSGVALNLEDVYLDKRFNKEVDQKTGYRTRTLLAVPIPDPSGRPMGVVQALNKRNGVFTVEDERLLEALSHQVSVAITDALKFEEIKDKNVDLRRTQAELQRRVQELDLLVDVESAMADATSVDELLEVVVRRCTEITGAGAASAAVLDNEHHQLRFQAAAGVAAEEVKGVALSTEKGLIAHAVRTGETVKVDDASSDPRHDKDQAEELSYMPGPMLCVPIVVDGRPVGALEVMRAKGERPFTQGDERILQLLSGRVAGAMAATRRRERTRQEEQLRQIGHMLSGVVHDFKTPMTVISGYVQLMAMATDEEERSECAELVLKQTDLMTSMTKELLQFARGESEILLRKVYLHTFIKDLQDMLTQLFADKNIELVIDVNYRGAARFDEVKIQRAIVNLARNSMEAMGDEGGRFTLSINQTGDQIELACADNGPGLAPEIENRLFESFATHGKEEGTGLGLALVKKLVEDHNGDIRVESKPGEGATFRLRLPL